MPRHPWFKCYPSDFLNGVSDYGPNEGWVYTICLMRFYDEGAPIDDDPEKIGRRCNMRKTSVKKAIDLLVLDGNITRKDGKLFNTRALSVAESRSKVDDKSAISRQQVPELVNENNDPDSPAGTSQKLDTKEQDNSVVVGLNSAAKKALEICHHYRDLESDICAHPPKGFHHTDIDTAKDWVEQDIGIDQLTDIFRTALEKRRDKVQSAPRSLSYFVNAVKETVEPQPAYVSTFVSEPLWQSTARLIHQTSRLRSHHPQIKQIFAAVERHDHTEANRIAQKWLDMYEKRERKRHG